MNPDRDWRYSESLDGVKVEEVIRRIEADATTDNRQSLYHFRIDSSGPELRKVQPLTMAGVYGDYFDKPANRVEIVKAYLSEMPQEEREEIYRWLHNTWNCRVYK